MWNIVSQINMNQIFKLQSKSFTNSYELKIQASNNSKINIQNIENNDYRADTKTTILY